MLAFRIEVDDHPPLVAGVEDWKILALHVNAVRGSAYKRDEDDLDFSVGGMTKDNEEGIAHHFRWPRVPLKIGSTVRVTIVNANTADPPVKRYRADKEVQENPFTDEEMRKMRFQDYLALKKEFETGS